MSSDKVYNIIWLGETGTGKSLLVNSFANYFHFDNLKEAIESDVKLNLIPSTFKVTDVNDKEHTVISGKNDGNERTEVAESMTIECKSYMFQSGDVWVRLIDTPGVGDTKGEEANKDHVANILSFINQFENLHAIAIVMNNTQTKLTDRFNDCLQLLLTNLHKSAVDNIVFLFTFSSGNNFKPGPVTKVVELFITKGLLKNSSFNFDKNRKYCLDNLSYEILVATQDGVKFDEDDFDSYELNWRKSSAEMTRLLKYVSELTPHKVRDTESLNDARQFIKVIQEFLLVVLKNIDENAILINKFEKDKQMEDENVTNMKSDNSFKLKDIKIVEIDSPITFCKSQNCRKPIMIGGNEKYHYDKECCKGCHVNNKFRWWCKAIDWDGYCKECGCHKDEHDRKFHKTEIILTNFFTEEALKKFTEAKSAKEQLEIKIRTVNERKAKLMHEKSVIEDAEKQFAKFFQEHALTKSSKEQSEKNVLEKYKKEIAQMKCMSIDEIYQLKNTLLNLPIYGDKMKAVLNADVKGSIVFAVANEKVTKLGTRFESCFSQ